MNVLASAPTPEPKPILIGLLGLAGALAGVFDAMFLPILREESTYLFPDLFSFGVVKAVVGASIGVGLAVSRNLLTRLLIGSACGVTSYLLAVNLLALALIEYHPGTSVVVLSSAFSRAFVPTFVMIAGHVVALNVQASSRLKTLASVGVIVLCSAADSLSSTSTTHPLVQFLISSRHEFQITLCAYGWLSGATFGALQLIAVRATIKMNRRLNP